jgi:ubiquitin-conjugating enzyme E2 Q
LSDVRAGSESGSFYFTYATPSKAHTIDVEATVTGKVAPRERLLALKLNLAPDTSDYPKQHNYIAFATSSNVPDVVPIILESLHYDGAFHGLTIQRFLKALSEGLDEATLAEDSQWHSLEEESDEDEQFDEMDWEEIGVAASANVTINARASIRDDLRKARQAGFRVGHLGDVDGCIILSASYRISKLGISHEAMEAWRVRPSEYLVLLIRYPSGYRPLPDVIRSGHPSGSSLIQLYAGLCESYKPSLASAQHIFLSEEGLKLADQNGPTSIYGMEPVLKSLFIGKSLQSLLNDRFVNLVKHRLEHGLSWPGAELYLNDGQGRLTSAERTHNPEYHKPDSWRTLPPVVVSQDHLAETESPSEMSLLLIAMQFTLRRFVKCTEFCLNCYCKIDANFEALKPYVCTKKLCLFQYINLGMGPSLEWEISSQPYVVDLLISFAYARAQGHKLEDFPTGLNIQVPNAAARNSADTSVEIGKGQLKSIQGKPCLRLQSRPKIYDGDWIVLLITIERPGMNPITRKLHARVEGTSGWPEIILSDLLLDGEPFPVSEVLTVPGKDKVSFVLYDTDFETLPKQEKADALNAILNTLPTVTAMKDFIEQGHAGHLRALAEWKDRIHPGALQVLQWIVGSNRSVIMYDDNPQHQVSGMDGYLQFRFAQGAPDKEQLFVSAVSKAAARLKLAYPTLFAWHGSGLSNWHSIVREGLHYKYIAHGRSYGNGIYMAQDFNTSLTYTGHGGYRTNGGDATNVWQKSQLKCQFAISLNEVVNAPAEFVSHNPFLVVQHVDWVQPRYLFVKCHGEKLNRPKSQPLLNVYAQDPKRPVTGPSHPNTIQIPISAINSHRAVKLANQQLPAKAKAKNKSPNSKKKDTGTVGTNPIIIYDTDDDDAHSVATLAEDRDILLSDDEEITAPTDRKWPDTKMKFEPGSLDSTTIQLLGEPAYATSRSTRSLQRELNAARKAQNERPLHELGWYIHSDIIQNMYQWIVELHSFDKRLPLAQDLMKAGYSSVVMEIRFPSDYPLSPPFLRVIRPRFLRYSEGGGGHVTAGGAMCMELLTNSGWLATSSIESILLQVWMAITNEEPRPARLDRRCMGSEYGVFEAISEYKRVCNAHGWKIPKDIDQIHWK